jgi:hypothetical protein
MPRSNEQEKSKQQKQQQQQEPVPQVIRSTPFDPNDLDNYIREPGDMLYHIRDTMPSEIAYRL